MKTDMNKGLVSKAAKKTIKRRESKGPPFISKPEIILFKVPNADFLQIRRTIKMNKLHVASELCLQDCDVGKVYKKKVTLTNVTYTTNYCKLLGVSQNLKDHVTVR